MAGLRTIADRNLEEARGPLKYPDTRFWLAYQAVLAAATIVIRAHGARVRRERQHERTFAALRQLAIAGVSDRARYYDDCRRKRNVAEYDVVGAVSDTEATALLREAERLVGAVRDLVAGRAPRPDAVRGSPSRVLGSNGRVVGGEVKAAATVRSEDAGLRWLAGERPRQFHRGVVLYLGDTVIPLGERLHAVPVSALWQHTVSAVREATRGGYRRARPRRRRV